MRERLKTSDRAGTSEVHDTNEKTRHVAPDSSPLSRLRLLVALDALLVEQSVGRAAARMGLGAPAMSRLLKQIRDIYGDPILRKTGCGMMPTPFAEQLRLRLRALAEEAGDLLRPGSSDPHENARSTNRVPLSSAPSLSLAPLFDIGGPTPRQIAAKLDAIGPRALPQQRLAKAIATMGAGVGRSRPLTVREAEEAFGLILAGQADPIQVGSFLSILQYRHATAPELAGMVKALRTHVGATDNAGALIDLDWPAYLSPKIPLQPWFLMAAKLVSTTGVRVLVHGQGGLTADGERLKSAARFLGIPVAANLDLAQSAIKRNGIVFLPFEQLSDQLTALMALYRLFEMRSAVNQIVHLTNPLGAPSMMLGAIQSSHKDLIRETAALLGLRDLVVTATNRDVAEATPMRSSTMLRLVDGKPSELMLPASKIAPVERPVELSSYEYWQSVWLGQARDEGTVAKIVETTALALMNIRRSAAEELLQLRAEASSLWQRRDWDEIGGQL